MKPGLMPTALAMFLTALLAIGAQATMTTVNPLASKAKQNVRSTKVAAGEAETHLLVYKVRRQGRSGNLRSLLVGIAVLRWECWLMRRLRSTLMQHSHW
jgi:hypothetical protein